MIDYGAPMRTFYGNLRAWGFQLSLDDAGGLVVKSPATGCPPLLADAITQRRGWLVKLVELDGLLGRPLLADDAARCRALAAECGVDLEWQRMELNGPTAGKWETVTA